MYWRLSDLLLPAVIISGTPSKYIKMQIYKAVCKQTGHWKIKAKKITFTSYSSTNTETHYKLIKLKLQLRN